MRAFKPGRPGPAAGRLRVRRARPRAYQEWKALQRWRQLPAWESSPPGYVLRLDREEAGLTQAALAKKLGCSQQAVAQAERWTSNPTVEFVRRWRKACGERRPLENFVAESGRYGNSESGKPFRLDPDLALRFKTSTAVNRALRELISERARERRSKMRSKTR